jgi:hypothetical protein
VSNRDLRNEELLKISKEIFEASGRLYGAPRVHAELRLKHHEPGAKKLVARLMRLAGLRGRPWDADRGSHDELALAPLPPLTGLL